MSDKLIVGVDIGGTKIAAGVVDGSGQVLNSLRVPMNAKGEASAAMQCVHTAIRQVLSTTEGARATAIGVASPGPLDLETGTVLNSPNLPCWRDFPLLSEIKREYTLPVRLENDANAAGLAEALWGAGRGFANVLYLTLGTGIGTALILDGVIYGGRTGAAPEGGHMTIDYRGTLNCACGKPGCVEGMVSGPAIGALARRRVAEDLHRGQTMLESAGGAVPGITAEVLFKAALNKDPLAQEIMDNVTEILAIWVGNLLDILEPHVVVIGGGVGSGLTFAFENIRQKSLRWALNSRSNEIPFLPARYGVEAGLVGSTALWQREPGRIVAAQKSANVSP
jgi:glucokinase